jgi:ABC-type cobalamin transport system permease subunit
MSNDTVPMGVRGTLIANIMRNTRQADELIRARPCGVAGVSQAFQSDVIAVYQLATASELPKCLSDTQIRAFEAMQASCFRQEE